MSQILAITINGTLAGVLGTGIGGILAVMIGKPEDKVLSCILALAGGIMLSVVFADLIPEALEYANIFLVLTGLVLGIAAIALLDKHLPHSHLSNFCGDPQDRGNRFIRTSILLGIGIAMHNFPEGLAIGAGYIASEHVGLGLALAIGIHNIPEGMAIACPMKIGGVAAAKTIFWTGLAGLPMGMGAFLGALVGGVSDLILALALGFASGAMLYVVFAELLPDAKHLASERSDVFGVLLGIVFGLLFLMFV